MSWAAKMSKFATAAIVGYEVADTMHGHGHEVQIVTVTVKPIDIPAPKDNTEFICYTVLGFAIVIVFGVIYALFKTKEKSANTNTTNNAARFSA